MIEYLIIRTLVEAAIFAPELVLKPIENAASSVADSVKKHQEAIMERVKLLADSIPISVSITIGKKNTKDT